MTEFKSVKGPGLDKLNFALKNLEGKVAKVGWVKKTSYDTGTPVAYVASINEFGVPGKNIPARPFMRPTIIKKKEKMGGISKARIKSSFRSKIYH